MTGRRNTRATWRLARNVSIVEKPRLENGAVGWAVSEDGKHRIEIKRSISEEEKALVVIHEIAHLVQNIHEDYPDRGETVAKEMEMIFAQIVMRYPPFLTGCLALLQRRSRA